MDVRDDRHIGLIKDLRHGLRRIGIRHRDTDDISPGRFKAVDLCHCGIDVGRQCVGHRLHRDRRITTNSNITYHHLPRLTSRYYD